MSAVAVAGARGASMQTRRVAVHAHLVLTVVAVVGITVLGRDQWFRDDDWAVLVNHAFDWPAGILRPHVEHLAAVPVILLKVLYAAFGVRSYLPYLLLTIVFHALTVHLLVRVSLRVGTAAWATVALGSMLLLTPTATDQMFFAINFTFGLSMCAALAALLLLLDDDGRLRVTNARLGGAAFLTLLATLSWSNGLLAGGLIGVWVGVRAGWRAGSVILGPMIVVYVPWLLLAGDDRTHGFTSRPLVVVRDYSLAIVREMATSSSGLPVMLAVAVLLLLVAGGVLWVRSLGLTSDAALIVAGLVVVGAFLLIVTAAQRGSSIGLPPEKYQHSVLVFAFPLLAGGLGWLGAKVGRPRTVAVAAAGFAVLHAAMSVPVLRTAANLEAAQESRHRSLVAAAVDLMERQPVPDDRQPDPAVSRHLYWRDLRRMAAEGALPQPVGLYTGADTLAVEVAAGLTFTDGVASNTAVLHDVWGSVVALDSDGCLSLDGSGTAIVYVHQPATIAVRAQQEGLLGTIRVVAHDLATSVQASSTWSGSGDGGILRIDRPELRLDIKAWRPEHPVILCGFASVR